MFASKEALEERFATPIAALPPKRYNIAPTDDALVIFWVERPQSALFRWGLLPPWAEDPSIGNRLINARAETLSTKPAFRNAYRHRRCLVLSTGFYEWHREGKHKTPYFIYLHQYQPFAFAGIWEKWQPTAAAPPLYTFTLITVPANELVAQYHDRMPAMLLPDHESLWLHPSTPPATLQQILQTPYPAEAMAAHPVSLRVNNPRNDDPSLIEPINTSTNLRT